MILFYFLLSTLKGIKSEVNFIGASEVNCIKKLTGDKLIVVLYYLQKQIQFM